MSKRKHVQPASASASTSSATPALVPVPAPVSISAHSSPSPVQPPLFRSRHPFRDLTNDMVAELVPTLNVVREYMDRSCRELEVMLHATFSAEWRRIDATLTELELDNASFCEQLRQLQTSLEEKEYVGEMVVQTDRGNRWSTQKIAAALLRKAKQLQRVRRRVCQSPYPPSWCPVHRRSCGKRKCRAAPPHR